MSDAATAFNEAAWQWRDLGARFDLALCQLDLVGLVGADGSVGPAGDEATAIFEVLGAKPFLERLATARSAGLAEVSTEATVVPATREATALSADPGATAYRPLADG